MNSFDWNSGANAFDLFASMARQGSMFAMPNASTQGAITSATYFTRPSKQPFYVTKSLGAASPYADQMPLEIMQGRQRYGYNEPGAIPYVFPTLVDTIAKVGDKETLIKSEKMDPVLAARVGAPTPVGQEDEYSELRDYYSGMELGKADVRGNTGDALQAGYASLWKDKYAAGTWWR